MGYPGRYEATHFYPCAHRRGAHHPENRSALVGWRAGAPLPDGAGQRTRRAGAADRCAGGLRRENGTPAHPSLQSTGAGRRAPGLLTSPPDAAAGLAGRTRRAVAGPAAPQPPRLRPSDQPVDLGPGGPGQLRARADAACGQRRGHPPDPPAPGHQLEARQAVDHQPRSGVREKKSRRGRLIALARADPTWALGFADEGWWSRLARPHVHAWAEADQPLRLVEQTVAHEDPDPKALACYGLLLRRAQQDEAVWLRFVDGRPVSALTTQFLDWCCPGLEALGTPVWVLIWDNASWHVSKAVRAWIRAHNCAVKRQGRGVRILACYLPVKSPWVNPIEPKWVHSKRAIIEPTRLLSAQEVADRVCAYHRCPHEPHLTLPDPIQDKASWSSTRS